MSIPRGVANAIRFMIDELVPPLIRDSKWFMWIPFKLLFGKQSNYFFDFKKKLHLMSDEEIAEVYRATQHVHFSRATDLNEKCIDKIKADVVGTKLLDVGCGRGYLVNILEKNHAVTGVDFVEQKNSRATNKSPFIKADIGALPFADNSFDTVICTHTLEHVKDIDLALKELRRVCKHKLILVVPQQRPYQYTFDLHVHFFPYQHDFLNLTEKNKKFDQTTVESLDGDIYYQEFEENMQI